jgi:hypothetical protein
MLIRSIPWAVRCKLEVCLGELDVNYNSMQWAVTYKLD